MVLHVDVVIGSADPPPPASGVYGVTAWASATTALAATRIRPLKPTAQTIKTTPQRSDLPH